MIPRRAFLPGMAALGALAVARKSSACPPASDHLCVKGFGAVGDGVANDTGAFSAAITHLRDYGGALHVPAGKYKITGPLPYSDLLNRPMGMRIYGDGAASEIHPTLMGGSFLLAFANAADRVVLEDLAFVGDGVPTNVDCSAIVWAGSIRGGLEFSRCTFAGLRIAGPHPGMIDAHYSPLTLRGCYIGGCSSANAVHLYEFRSLIVDDCKFIDWIGNYNKTGAGGNGSWIWAERPNSGADQTAIEQATVAIRNSVFDEGATLQIRVDPLDNRRVQRVIVEDCNFNVSGQTGGVGLYARNVDRLTVARSRFSWAYGQMRDAIQLVDVDVAELDHVYAVSGANRISADGATQYLHLRDCVYTTLASSAVCTRVETKGVIS